MAATREFHIGDIISVTSGKLVSPRHVGGLYDLLGFMVGEPVWTHQLPRASREAEPSLKEQHPDLAAIDVPDWDDVSRDDIEATVMGWLAEQVAEFGETRQVRPLRAEDHTSIDPVDELRMMRPDAEIIVVDPSEAAR